jgi:hypothetical protein
VPAVDANDKLVERYPSLTYVQFVDQVATESAAGSSTNDFFCMVVPNQIKAGSAEDGRPHDLVLLAATNPDYLDPPLFFTDYDVVITREDGGDHTNTGVLVINLPVRFEDDWEITDSSSNALLTIHGAGGQTIGVGATLVGAQGVNDNLIIHNPSSASRVAVTDSTSTDDILRVTDDGAGAYTTRVFGDLAFTGASMTGSAPSIRAATNRLDVRGAGTSIRFLNNAFNAVNMTVSDAGDVSIGRSAPSTTATAGFPYVPVMAGTPSGTPTTITGFLPIVLDSSGSKLWAYLGGSWKSVTLS